MQDSLQYLPPEKWVDLQNIFKLDSPRSLMAYHVLETQKRWLENGLHYEFAVYCPYGDMSSGMVATIEKAGAYEIIIHCPRDDTDKLEDAMKKSKIIDWSKMKFIPAAPDHIMDCVKRISTHVNTVIKEIFLFVQFVLYETSPVFVDVRLPPEITFKLLSPEHVDFIDSVWPHRYPSSNSYFNKLVTSKNGYGLFKRDVLIAWLFIFDTGALGHLYVVEEHRRKGYGELICKLLCNIALKEGRGALAFALKTNVKSCSLFTKLGFKMTNHVSWVYFDNIRDQKSV